MCQKCGSSAAIYIIHYRAQVQMEVTGTNGNFMAPL